MSELDLRKLWQLHLIDAQLHEIRRRAAALDAGKQIQAELATLSSEFEAKSGHAKTLHAEQTDLELSQKSIDEKLKKIDRELYGGKVVNPREVENLQKEIVVLKSQRSEMDGRILELWEATPPAQQAVEEVQKRIDAKKRDLAEYQKKALQVKAELETQFKERSAQRPIAAKEVPPALLARYEAIRQKHGGIGMARVNKKSGCEACGTNIPTKNVETAKEGKLVTCESCHRILYASEGLL